MTMIPGSASTFTFNYSEAVEQPDASIGDEGYLTYFLQGANFNLSQPMELSILASSNVAHPIFSPSETGQLVAFDEKELLNVSTVLFMHFSLCLKRAYEQLVLIL